MADSGLQLKIIKANAICLIAKSQKLVIHPIHHRIEISCLRCKLWLRKKLSSGTHASFLITPGKFQICAIIKMFVHTFRAYDRRFNEFPWRSLAFHLSDKGKSREIRRNDKFTAWCTRKKKSSRWWKNEDIFLWCCRLSASHYLWFCESKHGVSINDVMVWLKYKFRLSFVFDIAYKRPKVWIKGVAFRTPSSAKLKISSVRLMFSNKYLLPSSLPESRNTSNARSTGFSCIVEPRNGVATLRTIQINHSNRSAVQIEFQCSWQIFVHSIRSLRVYNSIHQSENFANNEFVATKNQFESTSLRFAAKTSLHHPNDMLLIQSRFHFFSPPSFAFVSSCFFFNGRNGAQSLMMISCMCAGFFLTSLPVSSRNFKILRVGKASTEGLQE